MKGWGEVAAGDLGSVLHLRELAHLTRFTVLILAPIFGLLVLLEKKAGADDRRYLSRNFFNDVLYTFFYQVPYTVFILLIVDFSFYWVHRLAESLIYPSTQYRRQPPDTASTQPGPRLC